MRNWARSLPPRVAVVDLGCGSGLPITKALVSEELNVYGIDASPSLVEAFRHNLPSIPVACEAGEDSSFFNRMFDGAVAWGLIFLHPPEEQQHLIHRVADFLVPGGRLLFTLCAGVEPLVWNDAMTGLESRSLSAAEYRKLLSESGLNITREYEDEGQNHYFDALKEPLCIGSDEPVSPQPPVPRRERAGRRRPLAGPGLLFVSQIKLHAIAFSF